MNTSTLNAQPSTLNHQRGPLNPQPSTINPPRAFTLIEMLVVITIIGILVALLFPAIGAAIKKAKVARTRSEVQTIVNGVRAYYTEYGKYPHDNGTATDKSYGTLGGAVDNLQLLNVLRAISGTGNASDVNNPRKIVFIEVPAKSVDTSGNFLDPWSNQYEVTVDVSFNNTCNDMKGGYADVPNCTVAAWSRGPDKKTITDATQYGDDDVCSWK